MIFYCSKCSGHLEKENYRNYVCTECKHHMFGLHRELDPLGRWLVKHPSSKEAEDFFLDDIEPSEEERANCSCNMSALYPIIRVMDVTSIDPNDLAEVINETFREIEKSHELAMVNSMLLNEKTIKHLKSTVDNIHLEDEDYFLGAKCIICNKTPDNKIVIKGHWFEMQCKP